MIMLVTASFLIILMKKAGDAPLGRLSKKRARRS